jgi:putative transposase
MPAGASSHGILWCGRRRRTRKCSCRGTRTQSCTANLASPARYEPADRFRLAALPALIPPAAPARGLPSHPRYPACPAPQVHRREAELHRTPAHRTPAHPGSDQDARPAAGRGESALGPSADPRGDGPARTPDRRLDGLGDPQRGGHRPGAASLRPDLARVPHHPSREHHPADFFPLHTMPGGRWYALAFPEHGTRRLHITGATAHPTREWGVQQVRNLAADPGTRWGSLRFLLRDRDGEVQRHLRRRPRGRGAGRDQERASGSPDERPPREDHHPRARSYPAHETVLPRSMT